MDMSYDQVSSLQDSTNEEKALAPKDFEQRNDRHYADTFSVLRFIKSNKSKSLEISPSGFTVKVNKSSSSSQPQKKGSQEELVLTNMAFYSGLHLWEIVAPISCNNLSVGVHNPVANSQVMTSFKTTTQRVITVCLDLNENQLKFWLNERRSANKTLKLPEGGPWVPCIKISTERNKVVLNPFAREPSDFYEKEFDKKHTMKKHVMPYLINLVCVRELPRFKADQDRNKQLRDILKVSDQEISQILIDEKHLTGDDPNQRFCFIQFQTHELMGDFIRKCSKDLKITQAWELCQMFEDPSVITDQTKAIHGFLREQIQIKKVQSQKALEAIDEHFKRSMSKREGQEMRINGVKTAITQNFSDKIILVTDQGKAKLVARNHSTSELELDSINMNKIPQTAGDHIVLSIKSCQLRSLFTDINWSAIFKEDNPLSNSIIAHFFSQVSTTLEQSGSYTIAQVSLDVAKFFLDITIPYTKAHLERLKRQYQNYLTPVPSSSLVHRSKLDEPLESLEGLSFFKHPAEVAVDEVYQVLNLLHQLQEQVWACTKDSSCPPHVKAFVQSVARPFSTFNRLQSFVTWPVNDLDIYSLAEKGFFWKETQALSQFENPSIDLLDLQAKSVLDQDSLEELYGPGNRLLACQVSENVPMYKTINYLPPQSVFSNQTQIIEAIASQNSSFVVFGDARGNISVCSSMIGLARLKAINFFNHEQFKNKISSHLTLIQKVKTRQEAFDQYFQSNLKKLAPVQAIQDLSNSQSKQQLKQIQKAQHAALKIQKVIKEKKAQSKNKPKKQHKVSKTKQTAFQPIDEVMTLDSLFGEAEEKKAPEIPSNFLQVGNNDVCVIGYFLLSRPAIERAMDPLTVGCVFQLKSSGKFYIRVRKLSFSVQYLQSFLALDPVTGLQVNKINGKQLNNHAEFYQDVLNHQDSIVDLYAIFNRNQTLRNNWTKKDERFSVFSDISQGEIEIEDCKKVIDFTRCSYSIGNQDKIHLLIENMTNAPTLVEFNIKSQLNEEFFFYNISLSQGKSMPLDQTLNRVLAVDRNLVLVGPENFLIVCKDDFKVEVNERLCRPVKDWSMVSIVNDTQRDQIFNYQNLKKFNMLDKIPCQQWKLIDSTDKDAYRYSVKISDFRDSKEAPIKKQKTELASSIDLSECYATDIIQIGSLLESSYVGSVAKDKPTAVLTSTGQDGPYQVSHSWHILQSEGKSHDFELSLPQSQSLHLKQIELQFSFTKQSQDHISIIYPDLTPPRSEEPVKSKHLPLVVECFTGAQLNDVIQVNNLTSPDAVVFSSNYPQPEFVFRHQHSQKIIPHEFVIRSKENRVWNGIPISQGLIFVGNCLDDLLNTKNFSKFTKKDYQEWRAKRDLLNLPLLPNEPILYFDLEEKPEIVVQWQSPHPVKFIKMVPTAFRAKPINFTSKAFHSNQAEIQFFGVNGLEYDYCHAQNVQDNPDSKQLQVQMKTTVIESSLGEIGAVNSVSIDHLKGPKASNLIVPLISLNILKVNRVTGVANVVVTIAQDHSDCIKDLRINISDYDDSVWTLQGLKISVKAYTDLTTEFESKFLQDNKPRLRHYLLDVTQFDKLLKQLINLAQDSCKQSIQRQAAFQCILSFLQSNMKNSKTYQDFLNLFISNTDVKNILNDGFVTQTSKEQELALSYLDKTNLLKVNSDYIANTFIKSILQKLLQEARPIQKLKTVLDLLNNCQQEHRSSAYDQIAEVFIKICNEELPKYQTPENIILRSKLNINAFPFDDCSSQEQLGSQEELQTYSKNQVLECCFEFFRMNTVLMYKIELDKLSNVDMLKLFFEQDAKNLFKINVKVAYPDSNGYLVTFKQRLYDENIYSQLCDKGLKADVIRYFNSSDHHGQNAESVKDEADINCLHINLAGLQTKVLHLQIELLDTFRSVHKEAQIHGTFIRPELYGHAIEAENEPERQISSPSKDYQLGTISVGEYTYTAYAMVGSVLSQQRKAAVFQVKCPALSKQKSKEEEEKEIKLKSLNIEEISEQREVLRGKILQKPIQKKEVKKMAQELQQLSKSSSQESIGLRYLLQIGDLLAGHIIQSRRINWESTKSKELYKTLFKRFVLYDKQHLYPRIQSLMEQLFSQIQDKSEFICSIFSELVINQDDMYDETKAIEFIQKQKNLDFNQLLLSFCESLFIPTNPQSLPSNDSITQIFLSLDAKSQLSNRTILAILSMIDDFNLPNDPQNLKIDQLFMFVVQLLLRNPLCQKQKDEHGMLLIEYGLGVLLKFTKQQTVNADQVIKNCSQNIIQLLILVMINDEKDLNKPLKELIGVLADKDSEKYVTKVINSLLQWYKDKENKNKVPLYSSLADEGLYFKHLAIVFRSHVNLLRKDHASNTAIEKAYEDLDSLTNELLGVIVADQNSLNYEENFYVIWRQIYKKTLAQLQTQRNQSMVDNFAESFYKLSQVHQECLYPRFHRISERHFSAIAPSHDPQASIALLRAFLFKGFKETPHNVAYSICEGLINIIRSGDREGKDKAIKPKFNLENTKEIALILVDFLGLHCNQGCFTGVQGCSVDVVIRLDLAIELAKILTEAEGSPGVNAFENFIKEINHTDIITFVVNNLIQWLLFNYMNNKGKNSPSGSRIYSLSAAIESLVNKISASDEAVSLCLPILMKQILSSDYKLRELISHNKINSHRAIALQSVSNQLFLAFFKVWVHSDQVAKRFLTEFNGFDFLLDRLFSKPSEEISEEFSHEEGESAQDSESEDDEDNNGKLMSKIMQKLKKKTKKEPKKRDEKISKALKVLPTMFKQAGVVDEKQPSIKIENNKDIKDLERKITLDDYGSKIQLIWTSDKQKAVASQYAHVQWHKFKNGQKNRIYTVVLGNQYNYEYLMKFDLQDVIQLQEIQFGLLYNWSTYDQDSTYEPLTLLLEGGVQQDKADWTVILTPLKDNGYLLNSIQVYAFSFTECKTSQEPFTLTQSLESIGQKSCRYLTFKLRRPIMACLDQSMNCVSSTKSKSYGISYISVMGTQVAKPSHLYSHLLDLQKENSLEVLSKFFSGQFTEAFELISMQPQVIQKIQNAFDKLAVLLDTKAQLIKPIFLAICAKNTQLGDWIMTNRLLKLNPSFIKKQQILFLGDIISSSKEMQLDKIEKLRLFICQQLKSNVDNKTTLSQAEIDLLQRYLKLYNEKLREYSHYLKNKPEQQSIRLNFETKDIDNAIALMTQCESNNQKFFKSLISFTLILLSPPPPFKNETVQVNSYIETLLKSDDHQLQTLLFASIVATTNSQALESILAQGKIEWVRRMLKAKEKQYMFQCSSVLYNCSLQNKFRELYRKELTFELYETLKNEDLSVKMLREGLSDDVIKLLVQTISNLVVDGVEGQQRLSKMLQEDLLAATSVSDVEFINKVIVPILHSEKTVPITISVINRDLDSKVLLPIYASSDPSAAARDTFFLKTNLLNKRQKEALLRNFKEISSPHVDNFQQMQKCKWDLIFSDYQHQGQDSSKFAKFVATCQNKSNFFVLCQAKILDQIVVFGGYSRQPFPSLGDTWNHEFDYQVPTHEANFVFHYTPEKENHFTMLHSKPFGYIYTDYEEGGALSVSGDFFLISWSYEFQNSCGNIYDMKCIEEPTVVNFYNNMDVKAIEIWSLNTSLKQDISEGKLKSELKLNPYFKPHSPYNVFRENIVFEVSDQLTLSHVAQQIMGKQIQFVKYPAVEEKMAYTMKIGELQKPDGDPIIDLVYVKEAQKTEAQPELKADEISQIHITTEQKSKEEAQLSSANLEVKKPLLKLFEASGGIFDLIKAAKSAVKLYQNDKLRDMWGLWLSEIESFSQLPDFFNTFCKDRQKEQLIYGLLEGINDFRGENQLDLSRFVTAQEEMHLEMVKYSYKIVSQVFEQQDSSSLREECLKNGTFERFIERIGQLSSEKRRTKVVPQQMSESSSPEKLADGTEGKKQKKQKEIKQEISKRKGVGYTTGVGTTWNVSEYLKSKEAKSSQAANIVTILKNMIHSSDWEAPPKVKSMILESALLPTLESAFRSGSLLEMAKDFELNSAYLGFVEELASHASLIDLLIDIGDEYEPRQMESVQELLKKIAELSKIFIDCLPEDQKNKKPETEEDEKQLRPKKLAESILQTNQVVQQKLKASSALKHKQSIPDILALPLAEAYPILMKDLRFDTMDMKSGGFYNHAYVADLPKGLNPPVTKLVRLAQEIADLSNSLPCDHTNAIFCRVDKSRVDVMKCLIMGASGTPYAHGAFIYDLFFENSYPNLPPKCQLVTTGGSTVRFNPNLYNNGKVCLSLLGTWRGSATENWDPKLSTILQVLLSIQAIIMSNEVYFNEPGYEHEQGTVEGEKKNEGYSNIVRYCNVKFAIIETIKNPPAGFEKIIKRNYYLKKYEILKEVKEWVERAKTVEASYQGLVYDHNYTWAPQISPEGQYAKMIEEIYKELKQVLEALPSPFEDEETGQKVERKFSEMGHEEFAEEGQIASIEDIDVTYDTTGQKGSINIDDESVKDRWSRYIGAMGIEAVAKQAESRIMISGLTPLGVEIAKNIVLAGCKELIIHDKGHRSIDQLMGNFFGEEPQSPYESLKMEAVVQKLQQLNLYVKVTFLKDENIDLAQFLKDQGKDIKVFMILDTFGERAKTIELNRICRENQTAFIIADCQGVFARVFNDFGPEFIVLDKDGEEMQEVMIQNIEWAGEQTVVTLLLGFKHRFQDGDVVKLREVKGMQGKEDGNSINGSEFKVKVLNRQSFVLEGCDARSYTPYEGNGIAKQIKVPLKLTFQTLEEVQALQEPKIDPNLIIYDFEKLQNHPVTHAIWCLLDSLKYAGEDFSFFTEIEEEFLFSRVQHLLPNDASQEVRDNLKKHCVIFARTQVFKLPPLCAFIGGVVAQEAIKAITQKYTPINQLFYFDCMELVPDEVLAKGNQFYITQEPDKYQGIKAILGEKVFEDLKNTKVFMIGAGAIGCELLKNYAMLGLGTGPEGQIIVTDPDVIEVSNLNRQFLFREKHLRKPKSQTAAAAAIQMNPALKSHIQARLDKIHEGTAHIYNEAFFQKIDIVTNALDNIQARLYIDGKCVAARTPLIDSGTLGPKGHVQIVLPEHKTESYASQADPEDNLEIPHCTLKMFPEETLHCVEWAKDLFGQLFTLKPQAFNKVVKQEAVNFGDQQEITNVKKAISFIGKKPNNFEECIAIARKRFQKHFVNDIKQLLHVYPLDKQTKEGRPFWSLPKRPPHPVNYDPSNKTHQVFIGACALLFASLFNIQVDIPNPRSDESRAKMAQIAAAFEVKEFAPSDTKTSEIASQVEKEQSKEAEAQEEEIKQQSTEEMDLLKKTYEEKIKPLADKAEAYLKVEEFEKDNDQNSHIDFIYAMANIRAANYDLEEMEWINVKIKAGRIVPALATTTAAIAGLQTLELLKYIKGGKLTEHRNSFMNLAVPTLMMSEPGPAPKTVLKEGLEVTLWDRWEFNATKETTLGQVVDHFEKQHGLAARDIFCQGVPVYLHALHGKERLTHFYKYLLDSVPVKDKSKTEFVDLVVTFVDETKKDENGQEKKIEGVPGIRVIFQDFV